MDPASCCGRRALLQLCWLLWLLLRLLLLHYGGRWLCRNLCKSVRLLVHRAAAMLVLPGHTDRLELDWYSCGHGLLLLLHLLLQLLLLLIYQLLSLLLLMRIRLLLLSLLLLRKTSVLLRLLLKEPRCWASTGRMSARTAPNTHRHKTHSTARRGHRLLIDSSCRSIADTSSCRRLRGGLLLLLLLLLFCIIEMIKSGQALLLLLLLVEDALELHQAVHYFREKLDLRPIIHRELGLSSCMLLLLSWLLRMGLPGILLMQLSELLRLEVLLELLRLMILRQHELGLMRWVMLHVLVFLCF